MIRAARAVSDLAWLACLVIPAFLRYGPDLQRRYPGA